MNISFDKYHTYAEIRAFLQDCVREYPDFCRIECIGKSYQDREILMVELTSRKTGPGSDKPGIYTDANTHAGEVTGAEVILYTIKKLLEGYGDDPRITNLLDTRVFYFIEDCGGRLRVLPLDSVYAPVQPPALAGRGR